MDRQAAAVAYRQRLVADLRDQLQRVDIERLTLTELRDLLAILQPALGRQQNRSP